MKKYLIIILLSFSSTSCAIFNDYSDIVGTWDFVQMIDETEVDGEVTNLSKGHYIKIYDDHFLVMWDDLGNRFYKYERDGKNFILIGIGRTMTWTLISKKENELQILTPLGIFVLNNKRDINLDTKLLNKNRPKMNPSNEKLQNNSQDINVKTPLEI